jgi:aspartyl-tRNA(Asn)/glutamyl-tRNA(Gln) amidotransferase subunit C
MKVTEKDVLHVAGLAHLELTASERERMLKDLNSILDYMDRLNELDTSNVPPMTQTAPSDEAATSAMREDELRPPLSHEEAMQNAPETDGVYFKVPKVIDR